MFSYEFCEISKNTFFIEHLRKTASGVRFSFIHFMKISSIYHSWYHWYEMFWAIWCHLYNLKSVEKKPTRGGLLLLVKVTLLHGCFWRFLNYVNGNKSRKASHTNGKIVITIFNKSACICNIKIHICLLYLWRFLISFVYKP